MRAIDATSQIGGGLTAAGLAVAAPGAEFEIWRNGIRRRSLEHVADFVDTRCLPQLERTGVDQVPGDDGRVFASHARRARHNQLRRGRSTQRYAA